MEAAFLFLEPIPAFVLEVSALAEVACVDEEEEEEEEEDDEGSSRCSCPVLDFLAVGFDALVTAVSASACLPGLGVVVPPPVLSAPCPIVAPESVNFDMVERGDKAEKTTKAGDIHVRLGSCLGRYSRVRQSIDTLFSHASQDG